MKENNRFRAVKFRFNTDKDIFRERYMIEDNHIPVFRVNQRLELNNVKKASTGMEYAKKLSVFLNWLDNIGISYQYATNRHVRQFVH